MLFLGFGFWFWSLVLLELSLLTWFVEEEWGLASLLSLVVFIGLLWWLADVPIWTWLKDNPLTLFKYFCYYIGIGVVWSFCKYFFSLRQLREIIKEAKESWKKIDGSDKYASTFEQFLESHMNYSGKTGFNNTAGKLVFWSSFWPTSMIWTILNDPLRKLFSWIINDIFIGIYRLMYNRMIGNLIKETENEKTKGNVD